MATVILQDPVKSLSGKMRKDITNFKQLYHASLYIMCPKSGKGKRKGHKNAKSGVKTSLLQSRDSKTEENRAVGRLIMDDIAEHATRKASSAKGDEGKFGVAPGEHVAFYDIFRFENGKIAEHWDNIQTIPADAEWANPNGKFGF